MLNCARSSMRFLVSGRVRPTCLCAHPEAYFLLTAQTSVVFGRGHGNTSFVFLSYKPMLTFSTLSREKKKLDELTSGYVTVSLARLAAQDNERCRCRARVSSHEIRVVER